MKPSVLVYRDIPDDILTRLSAECDVHRVAEIDPDIDPSVKPLLAGADAILGSGGKIDARFLAMAPKLRVASTITVGYDNFDVSALSARNVVLMHTPDVLTETVADATMALVLATARKMIISSERVKRGEWRESITPDWYGCDVHHKTMGIAGMGRIGDALALKDKTILAAGLDVFEQEPLPPDSPLLSLDNVVLMPHIGSATHETRYAMAACAADNVLRALKGDVSQNCVNPQAQQQ